jgi:hypothetical protein
MKKIVTVLLSLSVLFSIGCSRSQEKATDEKQNAFPEARYLTAEGSGQTEIEARRQALAALSGIFESKVHAETTSFARAAIGSDNEELFEKNVESKIAIVSSVRLTGAQIGRVWQAASSPGTYHALAVIDRSKAGRNWADELETVTAKTEAEIKNLEYTTGRFQRMLALNRIVVGVLQKQALESRLRVLNYPARSSLDVDISQITAELARLRSQLRFFVEVSGHSGQTTADRLSEAFTANGLLIGNSRDEADALISGQVEIQPLSLNNPRAQFVRAIATVKIIETGTGAVVATLNESVRKGHVDQAEAARKAVSALSETLAERLISEIGFGGGDATD